jgi:hypothetical protein
MLASGLENGSGSQTPLLSTMSGVSPKLAKSAGRTSARFSSKDSVSSMAVSKYAVVAGTARYWPSASAGFPRRGANVPVLLVQAKEKHRRKGIPGPSSDRALAPQHQTKLEQPWILWKKLHRSHLGNTCLVAFLHAFWTGLGDTVPPDSEVI